MTKFLPFTLIMLTSCTTTAPKVIRPTLPMPAMSKASVVRPPRRSLTVKLEWRPSDYATGYRICYGTTSLSYTNVLDVGSALTCTVSNLVRGTTYYFAVKSYNENGESDFSNEASYSVPTNKTNRLLTITASSELYQSSTLKGSWTATGTSNLVMTNPPGAMFFRGTNAVIKSLWF